MPSVDVNGLPMYCEPHGEGPPLVLAMGLEADISAYGFLVDGLAGWFRVLAFDNRGAGRTRGSTRLSPPQPATHGIAIFVEV
jgi:pimeloyl-ACP methyl ester carboxylesterase